MKGTITFEGDQELAKIFSRMRDEAKPEAVIALRSTSLSLMGRVKAEMPVDTGRARASWGQWTPADATASDEASADDAIYEETDGGLTVTQGSNVPYIKELNEGHSQQRAAGFIDAAFKAAQDMLMDALTRLLERFE